jgi:hypothetical protein
MFEPVSVPPVTALSVRPSVLLVGTVAVLVTDASFETAIVEMVPVSGPG